MPDHNRNHSANTVERECSNDRLSMSETIASSSLAILGLLTALRGFAWIHRYDNPSDVELYASLISVAPLYIWGSVFAVGGILLALSSWFLPRRDVHKRFAFSLFLGGLTSSVTYFVVAIAAFNTASTWFLPTQMIVLALYGGILTFFGGMQLWQMHTMKRNI